MANMTPDAKAFYKERLSNVEALLVALALAPLYLAQAFLDVTVFLSLIAAAIGFVATTLLTLFYMMKGVWGIKKNTAFKTGLTLVAFLIEVIPELDLIPADLVDLAGIAYISRKEDREIAEEKAAAVAKAARDQQEALVRYANYQQKQQEATLRAANANEESEYAEAA